MTTTRTPEPPRTKALATVAQAAQALQMHPGSIRRLIRQGHLDAVRTATGRVRVTLESVRRFAGIEG